MPQSNEAAYQKRQKEEETPPNRNNKIRSNTMAVSTNLPLAMLADNRVLPMASPRSNVRSAKPAASQLPGGEPTDVDDVHALAHLSKLQ